MNINQVTEAFETRLQYRPVDPEEIEDLQKRRVKIINTSELEEPTLSTQSKDTNDKRTIRH